MHNSLWFIKSNGKQNPNSWPPPQQSTDSGPTPYKLWMVMFKGSIGNQWCWFIFSITHMFIGTPLSQKNELKQREKDVPIERDLEWVEMVDVTRTIPYPTPHRCSFPDLSSKYIVRNSNFVFGRFWIQILPLLLMSYMSLSKLLNFSFFILVSYHFSTFVSIQ